ncbi:AEC family transporter [Bergeriella denitrificans]|uniref:Auxin efflux carrier n=1 Tax=Bergeriella denitrificans TaxID=494 RepID=A0A378UIT3_BERDE|nr:AEC family transporter [Bergeriella denitrificans]STZ76401.1 auxin efflux carrier [Bergeriella denitrificans]
MTAIFHIIAPVFLLIFIGYAAMQRRFFTAEQLNGLGKFVVRIGMPMLVFSAIATRPMAEVFKPEYFYGYSAASVAAFFIGWLVSRKRGLHPTLASLNGLAVGMSNSGFVGYPLLLMAVGPTAAVYFAMNVLTESLLIFPLLFAFLDWSKGGQSDARALLLQIVKNLLTNPIIIAMPVAMVFALGWLPLPQFAEKLSSMLAAATTPLALFMIGGNLYGLSIRGNVPDMLLVAAGKLVMCPLLVGLCLWLAGADKEMLFAGLLFAATPMASLYALFGSLHGFGKETSGAMLLVTVLSVIPIFLVLLLGHQVV